MATKKSKKNDEPAIDIDAFAEDLMKGMNEELGKNTVFNLGTGSAAIDVDRWISSTSEQLDWLISGRPNGGYPDGRLIEIAGPEAVGKSHFAYQAAKTVQQMGGITLYIDTESASAKENLMNLGIDIHDKKFIFCQRDNIESVFETIEAFIKKASTVKGDVPLCVVWDSVGGIGSIKDIEKEYTDAQQPGVDAKALKRGFRHLMNTVGFSRVLLIVINQMYAKIGAEKWEKKTITGGGNAIRYAATARIELIPIGGRKAFIFPGDMDAKDAVKKDIPPIGIKLKAKLIKNKLAAPFRSCELEIIFGVGLREDHQKWDLLNDYSPISLPDGREVTIGNAQWKSFTVEKDGKEISSDKFRKDVIREKMQEHAKLVTECVDVIMAERMKLGSAGSALGGKAIIGPDFDPNSASEAQALQDQLDELDDAFEDI